MEAVLEFFKSLIFTNPILEPLAPLLVVGVTVWGGLNTAVVLRQSRSDDLKTWQSWLAEDRYGRIYKNALGAALDRLARWIGDSNAFLHDTNPDNSGRFYRLFGCQPLTQASYRLCLTLALFYPLLTWLIFWGLGSSGAFGELKTGLETLDLSYRWVSLAGTVVLLGTVAWAFRLGGWKKSGTLVLSLAIVSGFNSAIDSGSFWSVLLIIYLIFTITFILLYRGGFLAGLGVYRSQDEAHRKIFPVAFAGAFALTIAGAFAVAFPGHVAVAVAIGGAVAGAFVGAVTGVFAGAFAGAVGGAVVIAVAVSGDFASAFAVAVSDAFAGSVADVVTDVAAVASAVAGALYVLLQAADCRFSPNYPLPFWGFYSAYFLSIAYGLLNILGDEYVMFLFTFWFILPLVNAPLDWLSLGVTRGLLNAIRTGHHSGYMALLWATLDLLLALVFLVLITLTTVLVIELATHIAHPSVFDLKGLLDGIDNNPGNPDFHWIYFMLLSTLIPTLCHFGLAGGAATLWAVTPVRHWILDGMENSHYKMFSAWAYMTLTPVIGFVLVPAWMLFGLWRLLTYHGDTIHGSLLDLMQWVT